MSDPYRPSDDTIGVIVGGAVLGLVGGSILGESPLFFIVGTLTLLGIVWFIVRGADRGSEGSEKPERDSDRAK